ncbi:MAG: TonB-dependent receptor [Prevotellaceae bacterium]|nr:TonB-dependent receptor [Prevotellaceae bacterium]
MPYFIKQNSLLTKPAVIALALIIMSTPYLQAQTDTTQNVALEQIDVLGQYSGIAPEKLHVVHILSRENIASLPVQNINELLDYLPGVDIRQRGANGVQADISIRGGSFDQVLILLNGVNITDPQTGHLNLDIPVDLHAIDRIELLQGTAMNIFGLSAFSGAVNIITGESEKRAVDASLSGGNYGLFMPSLSGGYSTKHWKWTGSMSHSESSGFRENTDSRTSNIFLQSSYRHANIGSFDMQIGGQTKAFGANAFYALKYPNQFEETQTLLGSLQWKKKITNLMLSASGFFRIHKDRFELFRAMQNVPSWYTFHNYHLTHTTGGNIKGDYLWRWGQTAVGVELRNEHIFSNVLGDPVNTPKQVKGEDAIFYTHAKNRLNINYFVQQTVYISRLTASVGLSGNYNSMFKNNFCYGASIGYAFTQAMRAWTNLNRSLRLPTFVDLYYQSATQESNPDIRPEEALTAELGWRWKGRGIHTSLSGYYRTGRNLIDWIKTSADEPKWRSMNHTRVDAVGFELVVGYSYGCWLKNIEAGYSYTRLDKAADVLLSKYALDYLKHKFVLSLGHGIYGGFGGSWQLSFQSREGNYSNVADEVVAYTPFCLLDGRLYWQNARVNIFVEGANLLNTNYYDYGGIIQPPRWLKAGIAVKLNLENAKK